MSDKKESKRYATRYGMHYSIVMKPSVTQVVNGTPMTTPGKTIEFENGLYETEDKAEQKFLEACPQFGRDFREVTDEMDAERSIDGLGRDGHLPRAHGRHRDLQRIPRFARRTAGDVVEIAEREADVEKREMALRGQGHEEGSNTPSTGRGRTTGNKDADKEKDKEKEKEEATF